jgi:hypothetical protein
MRSFAIGVVAAVFAWAPNVVSAQPVNFDFVLEVNNIAVNSASNPVAIGDRFPGRMTINLNQVIPAPPEGQFSVYDVLHGSAMTIWVNCHRISEKIDTVLIVDNGYAQNQPPLTYLDRFFVNAGDISPSGGGGMQFWIDERSPNPLLLSSKDIPPVPLDLARATLSTFVLRTIGLDFSAEFVALTNKGHIVNGCPSIP